MIKRISGGSDPSVYRQLLERMRLPLPYREYDEDNQVYHMDDGAMSVIFECKAYGGSVSEAGLITAMSRLPEDASMQILLVPSSDITKIIDKWKRSKTVTGELYELTRDSYANFLEIKTKEIISPNMRCLISDYKLIISINIGGRSREFSIFDKFKSFLSGKKEAEEKGEDCIDAYAKNFKLITDIKQGVQAALAKGNLYPIVMDPDRLIEFLFPLMNPKHDFRKIPSWQGDLNMSDQMVANDTVFKIAEDHFEFDGKYARSLSVKDYPYDWYCGLAEHLIGDPFGMQLIESTMALCLNIINLGKKGSNKIRRKSQIILSQNLPPHLFPRLAMKQKDLAMANANLEKGKSIFHINFSIMAFADDYDSLNNICSQIQAYYQQFGFILEEDRYINLPVFLSMLPGNYDKRFQEDLARGVVVFMENAVDLAPTAADWGGNTAEPEKFFITPRGQLFSFDLFRSDTNYNSFIIGTSGAGKSVSMQSIAMDYLMSGARVNIIDIGGSYMNFAAILNGQYIDVKPNPSNPREVICLNPFSDLTTQALFEEFAEFLTDWYWMMGSPAEPTKALEQEKIMKAYISKALKLSYNRYGNCSSVDTVIDCFQEITDKENDPRCKDFVQVMSVYATDGLYGGFFNGESQIRFNANLVVLETGSMEQIPNLRDPVLMILTYHISKSIYLAGDMKRKNLVIIDEAHKFLGNPRVDGFIEQAYRRFRKHLASMIIGTQGWEDLDNEHKGSKAGRVIIENSAFQIFMRQSPASREKLKLSKNHNFNDYEKSMIDSVDSIKGEFSEAIVIHDKVKVKIRIVLDDWQKRIFFTTPAMRAWVKDRREEGLSFRDALESIPSELLTK